MEITVDRRELASALAYLKVYTPKRPAVPVLAGIRVEVSDGRLTLASFDYEVTARVTLSGDGAGPGVILVDGASLLKSAAALPKGKGVRVRFAADEARLTVSADGVTSEFGAMPLEDYPALLAMPPVIGTVAGDVFSRAVARVSAAAGTDVTLPVLMCVEVVTSHEGVRLAATDRYRLATDNVSWVPTGVDGSDGYTMLLPAKLLAGYARKAGDKVALHFEPARTENGRTIAPYAALSDGTRELIVRDIGWNAEFPKWEALFPSTCGVEARVPASRLADALKRAEANTDRNMPVLLSLEAGALKVEARREGKPAYAETVPVLASSGDLGLLPRGVNAGYLRSMVEGIGGTAVIRAGEPKLPNGKTEVQPPRLYGITGADPSDSFRALVTDIKVA